MGGIVAAAAGCGDRATFEDRTVGEVQAALEDEGLAICETAVNDEEGFTGAVEATRLEVATPACDDDAATGAVTVEAYDSKRARDAAIRQFEAMARPPSGPAAAWTLGRFTVLVSPDSSLKVVDRVTDAMELIGAE